MPFLIPLLIPLAVGAAVSVGTTALTGGFSNKRPEAPEIPFGQTPEGIRQKKESVMNQNIKRQQAKFGSEDTLLTAGLAQASQSSSFRGNTLLGGQ